MICPEKSTIMMWIDGELPSGESDSISDHVRQCSSCRDFISAQKQMELVWRDAWIDPADSTFYMMRRKLRIQTPWWQTQRTWYIAAAVCAAYLGVRIFYLGGAGTPLSEIAIEETSTTIQMTSDEISNAPEEIRAEETISRGCEDQEQEFEIRQDESVTGQSELHEIEEELEICLSLSVSGSESVEEEDVILAGDDAVRHPETAFRLDAGIMEHLRDSSAIWETTEDSAVKVAGSGEYFRNGSDISEESAGFGTVGGALSGGTGGGGTGYCGDVSDPGVMSTSEGICDHYNYEDETNDVQSECPAQMEAIQETTAAGSSALPGESYSVSLTLESGETIDIQRDVWDSLFALIDSLQNQNYYSAGESLVFSVSNEGIISGPDVLNDTVIELPETGYSNFAVTVLFY